MMTRPIVGEFFEKRFPFNPVVQEFANLSPRQAFSQATPFKQFDETLQNPH